MKKICSECGYHKHDKPKLDPDHIENWVTCNTCGIFYTTKAQTKKKGGNKW